MDIPPGSPHFSVDLDGYCQIEYSQAYIPSLHFMMTQETKDIFAKQMEKIEIQLNNYGCCETVREKTGSLSLLLGALNAMSAEVAKLILDISPKRRNRQ